MPTGTCTTTKFSSIKARRMRVTAVDSCGKPIESECSTIVTSGFVSVGLSAQVEDGQEFLVKNAWGEFCVNEKDDSRVKWWEATLDFCEVDPELLALLSGGRVFRDTGLVATGGTFGEQVGTDFALELWTKIGGGACGSGGESWIYWVIPHLKGGVIGDLSFENGPLDMQIKATTMGASSDWGMGPYTPTILPEALEPDEHIGYQVTATPPPEDTCGCEAFAGGGAVAASGATEIVGLEGTWTPSGSTPPAGVVELQSGSVAANPNTAWTTDSYMQTGTSGVAGQAHWDGIQWTTGKAP